MNTRTAERIEDLYQACCGPNGGVELKAALKLMWNSLNNSVTIVDVAGVFAISIPAGNTSEVLTRELFRDFYRAFARLKYPTGIDYNERLMDEIRHSKGHRVNVEGGIIAAIADKQVMRVLLKYDLPLRRSFSTFCGQAVRVGSMVSWDEVKTLNLGMELDGFLSFAGAYSLVPQQMSTQQCELLFREVLGKFPLIGNSSTLQRSILYPQFQLLMAMIATERVDIQAKKQEKTEKVFAKKTIDAKSRPLADGLEDLFRNIGISKVEETQTTANYPVLTEAEQAQTIYQGPIQSPTRPGAGGVVHPMSTRPQDMYGSAGNNAKQSMLLRMEHLFDEIEAKLVHQLPPDAPVLALLSSPADEGIDNKSRLPTKPVVIGDAVPVPAQCPETVFQLLEAALAHHNQGTFDESLKFLEAARVQLNEVVQSLTGYTIETYPHNQQNRRASAVGLNGQQQQDPTLLIMPYFDVVMYITLCKGNVYQSCGDDEQSMLQYIEGWARAKKHGDQDWEIICLNSAGMLSFYNLRYDVALLCFNAVYQYRLQTYGPESSDTATAMNNEGCCLYCLNKRGDSRIRFEKAWNVMTKVLGHRAPRAVTLWKNLEKARRSHAPLQNKHDLTESVALRPDADRLLIGGNFIIQALPPPEVKKKSGKKAKKSKK